VALLHAPSKEALLESLDRMFLPETWSVFEDKLVALFHNETILDSESAIRTFDGQELFVRFSMTFSPDDPRAERVMVYLMDITERRRIEKQLRKANAELEQFANLATHDLQEPLRTVAAFTELLLDRYSEDKAPDVKEFAGYIQNAVQKMRNLIGGVQVYARAVRGEQEAGLAVADLNICILQAIDGCAWTIEETCAEVTAEDLPAVQGNQAEFTQVFRNLLGNSLKYRHPDRAPRIEVSRLEDGEWRICIRDNGIGFDPKYSDRIFGLFKRLHSTAYPGAGLGLAACRRIVERHGGRMWADSVPGEGSTFCFSCTVLSAP
jgi:light-regulated signal transduction histidine kinase (bacteriophytochrome)